MRAKDKINKNEFGFKNIDQIKTIIDLFYEVRDNFLETLALFISIIEKPKLEALFKDKNIKFSENDIENILTKEFRVQLLCFIDEDVSYGFLCDILQNDLKIAKIVMDEKHLAIRKKQVEMAIKYDFDDVLEYIVKMKNNNEKIDYLNFKRKEYFQETGHREETGFPYLCLEEIEYIKEATTSGKEQPTSKNTNRTMKVTTDILVELLKKAGVFANNDNTIIARLISYLTDFSEEKIRQRLSNTSNDLTSYHKDEIETINEILKGLKINISIRYNNFQ